MNCGIHGLDKKIKMLDLFLGDWTKLMEVWKKFSVNIRANIYIWKHLFRTCLKTFKMNHREKFLYDRFLSFNNPLILQIFTEHMIFASHSSQCWVYSNEQCPLSSLSLYPAWRRQIGCCESDGDEYWEINETGKWGWSWVRVVF